VGAIVVAISVGLLAIGVVGLLTVFSAVAVASLKVVSAAHEGGTWLADHLYRRWTR
jgi:hypothetical protein